MRKHWWAMALFLFLSSGLTMAQEAEIYQIYDKNGKKVSFKEMMKDLAKVRVVFFGELHNNAMAHWFELKVTEAMFAQDPALTLGAEMFETDDQIVLNEYLTGRIKEDHFKSEAKLWKNYATDYRPLIEFAKENKLPFIATNIPRRYASLVFREGQTALQSLDPQTSKWLCPLPFEVDLELPGYKNMIETMGGHMPGGAPAENIAVSQASKDATMAWFISQNLKGRFLHYNGSYHSNNFEGINWYLRKYSPGVTIGTIHFVEQDEIGKLMDENKGTADFVIVVPSDSPKSY